MIHFNLKASLSQIFKRRFSIAFIILLITFLIYLSAQQPSKWDLETLEKYENLSLITIICCEGRLGNKMGSYATLYALAKLNNRQAVLSQCNADQLKKIFEISLPIMPMIPKMMWIGHKIGWTYNPERDSHIPANANILTSNRYPDTFHFFDFARQDIRKEFRFREHLRKHAQKSLHEIKLLHNNATVFIGVHARRGDYLSHLQKSNRRQATPKFYHLAFEYFRDKYKDSKIVFVVASDDVGWCRNNLNGSDVYITKDKQPAEHDLALLSHCNHSIISYGTYGFWSAYLAGGDTVYLANATAPGSWYDQVEPENEFYLPEWVGICDITPDFWKTFKVVPMAKSFELLE